MSLVSTGAKHTPVLDESSFQQLLAAAFVVQQHNDGLRSTDPAQATSGVLTEIAEIQSLVRSGGLDLHTAALLTAERLRKITGADDIRIELFSDAGLENIAESGAFIPASAVARSPVALERVKQGELFQSSDTKGDIRLSSSEPPEAAVRALIAAPIASLSGFAGFIEAHWRHPNACRESDARACSLMAGLMGGILERSTRSVEKSKSSQYYSDDASSRNLALLDSTDTNERIMDNARPLAADSSPLSESPVAKAEPETVAGDLPSHCRVCGKPFEAEAVFCGNCSMPRVAGPQSENLQSKWASLWYMQQAKAAARKHSLEAQPKSTQLVNPTVEPSTAPLPELLTVAPSETQSGRMWPLLAPQPKPTVQADVPEAHSENLPSANESPVEADDQPAQQPEPESSQPQSRWLRLHGRATPWALSALSLLLFVLVIAAWPTPRNSQLTWFQSMLVQLGLADAPVRTSIPAGNPAAQVWVDIHTALYYCGGSDLFGKTPDGRLATQREAQEDRFEPAERTPCP